MQDSKTLLERAIKLMPGGVNSPVRSFSAVGGQVPYIQSASGAYLSSVEGKKYIDYVGAWGPAILGHAHPVILDKVITAMQQGFGFGSSTAIEIDLAERIMEFMPSIEMIRMVNSGTEATMSAIRLARGATGRNKIIKFEGCYHGHSDGLLVKAGSGALTLGQPSSKGVPPTFTQETLVADYNQLDSVERLFNEHGNDIAAVIVEPIAGNMSCVLPLPTFLSGLRNLCDKYGALLIFDEVMTGFRVAAGGAQALYNIKPDLTTLGKIIGGGFPVGAFGGRRDLMSLLAPTGPVYQAGTMSGNPIAMTAGLATLDEIKNNSYFYESLSKKTETLMTSLRQIAAKAGISLTTNHAGGLFGFFFTEQDPVTTYADATQVHLNLFKPFFLGMLNQGIYFAPSAFEAGFISQAHQEEEIRLTLQAAETVFRTLTSS